MMLPISPTIIRFCDCWSILLRIGVAQIREMESHEIVSDEFLRGSVLTCGPNKSLVRKLKNWRFVLLQVVQTFMKEDPDSDMAHLPLGQEVQIPPSDPVGRV